MSDPGLHSHAFLTHQKIPTRLIASARIRQPISHAARTNRTRVIELDKVGPVRNNPSRQVTIGLREVTEAVGGHRIGKGRPQLVGVSGRSEVITQRRGNVGGWESVVEVVEEGVVSRAGVDRRELECLAVVPVV